MSAFAPCEIAGWNEKRVMPTSGRIVRGTHNARKYPRKFSALTIPTNFSLLPLQLTQFAVIMWTAPTSPRPESHTVSRTKSRQQGNTPSQEEKTTNHDEIETSHPLSLTTRTGAIRYAIQHVAQFREIHVRRHTPYPLFRPPEYCGTTGYMFWCVLLQEEFRPFRDFPLRPK